MKLFDSLMEAIEGSINNELEKFSVCYHLTHPDMPVIGVEGCMASDVETWFSDLIGTIIDENGLEMDVKCIYMHGSRIFGSPRADSDIDIVVFYEGDEREDDAFNVLNEAIDECGYQYEGHKIDINPIKLFWNDYSKQIERYIEKNDIDYHDGKMSDVD